MQLSIEDIAIQNWHTTLLDVTIDAPQYQVQNIRRYGRNSYFWKDLSSHCDLDLEDRNPDCSHDTPGHVDVSCIYSLAVRKISSGQRYDRRRHGRSGSNMTLQHRILIFVYFFNFHCIHFVIPFRKFGPPYLGKATAAARAALPNPTSAKSATELRHGLHDL